MPSNDLDVAVRAAAPAEVGDALEVIITLTGEPDAKVRGVKVQLVRTAAHRVILTDVIGHGSHNKLDHDDVVVTEAPVVFPGGRVVAGEHTVEIPIPADALPTAADQVQWSLKAIVDRHHGLDPKATSPVEVLVGASRFASETSTAAETDGDGLIEFEDVSTRTLRPGGTVTGTVVVASPEPVTLAVLVAAFVQATSVKDGIHGSPVGSSVLLAEPLQMSAGETKRFPFELHLPDDAIPTVRGSLTTPPCHALVQWTLAARAEHAPAAAAGDPPRSISEVRLRLNVYNALRPS